MKTKKENEKKNPVKEMHIGKAFDMKYLITHLEAFKQIAQMPN